MITLESDFKNREAEFSLNNAVKMTKKGARQGLYQIGKLLKDSANTDILAKDKTGIVYKIKRGKVTRKHQSSAKGQTFANLSGAARRTLGYEVKGSNELEFGFRENSETEYTGILEAPTAEDGLSRPALGNAVRKQRGNSLSILEAELKKALL